MSHLAPDPEYISTKDAAERSGYHPDYLGRLARSGTLQAKREGRNWLINLESLQEFLMATRQKQVERARTLSKQREDEYLTTQATLPPLVQTASIPIRSGIASGTWRGQFAAVLVAVVVVGLAAQLSLHIPVQPFSDRLFALAGQIREGAVAAYTSASPGNTLQAQSLSSNRRLAGHFVTGMSGAISSSELAAPDIARLRMPVATQPDVQPVYVYTPPVDAVAAAQRWYGSVRSAFSSPEAFVAASVQLYGSASRVSRRTMHGIVSAEIAVGIAIQGATRGTIHAETALIYGTVRAAPETAQFAFSSIYDVGSAVTVAAAGTPRQAATASHAVIAFATSVGSYADQLSHTLALRRFAPSRLQETAAALMGSRDAITAMPR